MKHGSLFSGIGGFDLAAEWMGWENVFHCEWNEFGQKILKHYWPNAKSYGDITKTDFTEWRGKVDIVSGGFPCQPYSTAGKRKGKADDRHLWPEMLRAIREIQPRWVVGENVPGLLNWKRGMVLDEIKADLEAAGFEVFPSLVLPACGKNAPHRRDRLWIVAHSCGNGHQWRQFGEDRQTSISIKGEKNKRQRIWGYVDGISKSGTITNTECGGFEECRRLPVPKISYNDFQSGRMQTEPILRRGNDGLSNWVDRIKALGNAVVPQVAYEIFKAIEEFERLKKEKSF